MTTPKQLRERAERIRERPAAQATEKSLQRDYAGGGGGASLRWVIVRVVNETNGEIWGQYIQHATGTPVENDTTVIGNAFTRFYPPPGVQLVCFRPVKRPLLDAVTFLPIETNPAEGDEVAQAAFDAAMAAESLVLLSNLYPLLCFRSQGLPTLVTPIWMDPNVTFYDETRQMNEGSGI